MIQSQEQKTISAEFECVDPEVGEQCLYKYLAETLSEEQRQEFEHHLVFCHKCQEDLEYLGWAVQQLKTHWTSTGTGALTPLPVTSLVDGNLQDWLHDFYEEPFMEKLAASKETARAVSFPVTVKYAKGQVIGQFLKRGKQLFFRLKKSSNDCTLIYRSPSTPSESKTFEFREGEDKRLGPFSEFVTSNTIQGMLAAIKRFHLFMKRKEE
jgi:hypothetical protein